MARLGRNLYIGRAFLRRHRTAQGAESAAKEGKMRNITIIVGLTASIFSAASLSPALSRVWPSPAPNQIAADYAAIQHRKSAGEFVAINWFAAPTIAPSERQAPTLKLMLEKYVVVWALHCNAKQPGPTMTCDEIDTLSALDQSGAWLRIVPRDNLPPADLATLTSVEAEVSRTLGLMGSFFSSMRTRVKVFVFDAGQVHACGKGQLSIPFFGETYNWDTPMPGCVQN
jgi:hypothetical protein